MAFAATCASKTQSRGAHHVPRHYVSNGWGYLNLTYLNIWWHKHHKLKPDMFGIRKYAFPGNCIVLELTEEHLEVHLGETDIMLMKLTERNLWLVSELTCTQWCDHMGAFADVQPSDEVHQSPFDASKGRIIVCYKMLPSCRKPPTVCWGYVYPWLSLVWLRKFL